MKRQETMDELINKIVQQQIKKMTKAVEAAHELIDTLKSDVKKLQQENMDNRNHA